MSYFFDLKIEDSYAPGRYVYTTLDGLEWNLTYEITTPGSSCEITESLTNNLSVIGRTITKTAGENLAFGDIVYFKNDGKVWKAGAQNVGTYPAMAMATGTISANATGTFLLWGTARNDAWNWTIGGILYLSTVAGAITQTMPPSTDDAVQILGVAHVNADTIYFKPSIDYFTHT